MCVNMGQVKIMEGCAMSLNQGHTQPDVPITHQTLALSISFAEMPQYQVISYYGYSSPLLSTMCTMLYELKHASHRNII